MGDVKLGRLEFEWPLDDVPEALGGAVEAAGLRAVAGEPGLRSRSLKLPVRVDADAAAGERLRRQVRSALNNEKLRREGLYFSFDTDPEVNGWLVVAGGDITDGDVGITFAEWVLELRDVYHVGSMRTHWDARRLVANDRRLITTPRDYLGRLYSTDFEDSDALALHHVPLDATYVNGSSGLPGTVASGEVQGRPDGEILSFYLAEGDRGRRDVVVYDTRGIAPAFTAAGDTDSQAVYGWEEVYGTDYPLSTDDAEGLVPNVPVLANGIARVRHIQDPDPGLSSEYGFVLERRDDESAAYAPLCYLTLWVDDAEPLPEPDAVRVVEWTPERAVLALWFMDRSVVAYVTLQRGWRGPRIELYNRDGQIARMRVKVAEAGAVQLGRSDGTVSPVVSGTDYGDFLTRDPWLYLKPLTQHSVLMAVLQTNVGLTGRTGNGGVDLEVPEYSPIGPPDPYTPYPYYLSVTFGSSLASPTTAAEQLGQTNLIEAHAVPDIVTAT